MDELKPCPFCGGKAILRKYTDGKSGNFTVRCEKKEEKKAVCNREIGPAADVAPVVPGLWVEWYPPKHMILTGEEMLYRCSSCDAKYSDVEGFRFCPNCGARMDLEV